MACAGLGWTGTKDRFFNPSGSLSISRRPRNSARAGTLTTASVPRRSWSNDGARLGAAGKPPMYDRRCRAIDAAVAYRRCRRASLALCALPCRREARPRLKMLSSGGVEFANSGVGRLRPAALRRNSYVSPERRRRRFGYAAYAHYSRGRPHLQYPQAGIAVPGTAGSRCRSSPIFR